MTRVFISYSRTDDQFVDQLVADLKAAGVLTWRDQDDLHLDPDAAIFGFQYVIKKALDECTHMIVVLSEAAVVSLDVSAEWNQFRDAGKPLRPVIAQDCDIPPVLKAVPNFDLRDGSSYQTNLEQLIKVLPRKKGHHLFVRLIIKLVKLFIDRSDSKAATAPSVAGSDGDPAPATLSASPSDSPKPAVNTDSVAATGDAKPTSSMSGVSPVTIMTIVVVIVIIISLVVFGGNKLGISLANNPTYTSTPTTVEPTPETPTPPTPTKQPTATETPSPTPRDPAIVLAETGVESNAEWKPYIRVFDGVEMALVPAGCFIMGSEDGDSDETPMHEVCFDKPFWIDVYEVTNDQYGEAHAEDCMNWSKGGNQPRIYIDWYASAAHCESRGARLPTEAEWEYAARGPDGLIYPWGNDFECRHGNFDDEIVYYTNRAIEGGVDCDAFIETAPVGSFSSGVSWVGAHDMSGNVWEWVQDWYTLKYYTGTPESTPHEPSSIGYRVNRGGWWGSAMPHSLRGAERNGADPGYAGESLGFRCAHDYEPQGQDD